MNFYQSTVLRWRFKVAVSQRNKIKMLFSQLVIVQNTSERVRLKGFIIGSFFIFARYEHLRALHEHLRAF